MIVGVAQLVERTVVTRAAEGSSPFPGVGESPMQSRSVAANHGGLWKCLVIPDTEDTRRLRFKSSRDYEVK